MGQRKKFKKVAITPCPWHSSDKMGYLQFFEDCDKRDARGESPDLAGAIRAMSEELKDTWNKHNPKQ